MTRHELKEQVQHDAFTDSFSRLIQYSSSHREQLIRWGLMAIALIAVIVAAVWYSSHARAIRRADLASAFEILTAPVGPANQFGKSFPTEDAKRQASLKALAAVIAKDGGTSEGLMAQYYRGTLKAQQDAKGAESDLRTVADSNSSSSPLAKIALAQLYSGENRISDARQLLQGLVNKPTDLVSKPQAQILLAQLDQTSNPKEAKKILQSLQTPNQDPAVSRAAGQVSSALAR